MATVKVAISMPDEVLEEIDQVADEWFTSRSQAIVRIYLEWKRLRAESRPENELVECGEPA